MAVLVEAADEFPQCLAQLDVHARGRLVEHDHGRLVHQRLPDQHPPLHAAGERAHIGVGLRGEIEVVQDLVDPRVVVAQTEVARLDPERFANGEKRIENELLRHDPEEPPGPAIIGDHVVTEHSRRAAVSAGEPGDDRDQRGLAGAVGTEQPEEFALLDEQIDAGQRLHRAKAARDIDDFNRCAHRLKTIGFGRLAGCEAGCETRCEVSCEPGREVNAESDRFRDQKVPDVVKFGERRETRRHVNKRQGLGFGPRAALPGKQERHARRVDRLDTLQIDDTGPGERSFDARREHGGDAIHSQRTGGHPTLAFHLECGGDLAHLTGGGGGAGPLFLVSSALISPSMPELLTMSLNSPR